MVEFVFLFQLQILISYSEMKKIKNKSVARIQNNKKKHIFENQLILSDYYDK